MSTQPDHGAAADLARLEAFAAHQRHELHRSENTVRAYETDLRDLLAHVRREHPESTGAAAREVLAELRRIREELVEEAELAETHTYLTGVFPYTLQTIADIAKGAEVAQLIVTTPDGTVQRMPLVAAEAIGEAGFFGRLWLGLKQLVGAA